jgi:hypothetical protein
VCLLAAVAARQAVGGRLVVDLMCLAALAAYLKMPARLAARRQRTAPREQSVNA